MTGISRLFKCPFDRAHLQISLRIDPQSQFVTARSQRTSSRLVDLTEYIWANNKKVPIKANHGVRENSNLTNLVKLYRIIHEHVRRTKMYEDFYYDQPVTSIMNGVRMELCVERLRPFFQKCTPSAGWAKYVFLQKDIQYAEVRCLHYNY